MRWPFLIVLTWCVIFLSSCGSQLSYASSDGPVKSSADRTLWTIIIILTPDVPSPKVFNKICKDIGGVLTYTLEVMTDANGAKHQAALLKCFKRIGPPKVMT